MNIVFGSTPILPPAAAPAIGEVFLIEASNRVFQASVDAPGATATVAIQVSLDGTLFLELARIELDSAAGKPTDGFVSAAPWRHVRAQVLAVSGGSVSVYAGV